MTYGELVDRKASNTEIRGFLADGEMTAITFRIPRNLKDGAAEEARNRGMSFSAFVRMCLMQELAEQGER